jgi:transcriptional regulator with XRE-family HTH domain
VKTPGQVLREARLRHEVSQNELAVRAGTTQSAISRIEQDRISPSIQTLRELVYLLGEELILELEPRDTGVDATLNRSNLSRTPTERVRRGMEFADFVRRTRGGASGQGT